MARFLTDENDELSTLDEFPPTAHHFPMATKGALATLDDDAALDRIAGGEIMRDIAAEFGCRKESLRERLIKHPRYEAAIRNQAESLVERATSECMSDELSAQMPLIARARLRLEAAHKWAAARDPANWGIKQQLDIRAVTVQIVQFQAVGADLGATQPAIEHQSLDNQEVNKTIR